MTTKLRPMLALMPFKQGGIFIAPDLLSHGAAIFAVISNGRLYDQQRVPKMFSARNSAIIVLWCTLWSEYACFTNVHKLSQFIKYKSPAGYTL